jgi:hypothetical protein
MNDLEKLLAPIEKRSLKAHREICDLAASSGRERWRMTIPVDYSRDSDMVLQAPLDDITRLLAAIRHLDEALEKYETIPPAPDSFIEMAMAAMRKEAKTARAEVLAILKGE